MALGMEQRESWTSRIYCYIRNDFPYSRYCWKIMQDARTRNLAYNNGRAMITDAVDDSNGAILKAYIG